MTIIKYILVVFFISYFESAAGQEICDNGIDDDGNGLIDLNDTAGCHCTHIGDTGHVVTSLIPNPSFEQINCCPNGLSQMNCSVGWIQATNPTTDYLNTCGFICNANLLPGILPFPNGNACVATIFRTGWQEYIGSCLLSPMVAGQSYTIQMQIASGPFDGDHDICNGGSIFYGPVDITIYGSAFCSNMPISTFGCPPQPDWVVLGSVNYTPVGNWGVISITFTPTFNVAAMILGAPCNLPPSYNGVPCFPYFYFDNLILNTTASFVPLSLHTTGLVCNNDVVLHSGSDTVGGTWQWYKNGIALVGQTDSTLSISAGNLGTGLFSAVYTLGGDCEIVNDSFNGQPIQINRVTPTQVSCFGENDGSAVANVTGGTGTLSYSWNTIPIQHGPIASNLSAGIYTFTVSDSSGCSQSVQFTINQPPQSYSDNYISICDGEHYVINSHVYTSPGNYTDVFTNLNGCDSTVITHLSVLATGIFNQSQTICEGENYTISNHVYTIEGSYSDTIMTLNGCDSVVNTTLHVNPSYQLNNPVSICEGENYSINNNSYDHPGIYYDAFTTSMGCDSLIITTLSVNQLPILNFPHPDDVCIDANEFPLISATPAGGDYSGDGISNNVFHPKYASVGIHKILYSYIDPVTSCSNTIEDSILVFPLPPVEFTVDPKAAFLENAKFEFTDLSPTAISREWTFGDGQISTVKSLSHVFKDTGNFDVKLIIQDKNGCKNNSADHVYVGENFSFFVPNAFTPNADGLNDFFSGIGTGIKEYHLRIIDRWGKTAYTSNDIGSPWPGNGCPDDTYIYIISLKDMLDFPHDFKGSVSIIK